MDIHEAMKLKKLSQEQTQRAREYMEARKKAAVAKTELLILLTAKLPKIREKKKNAGMEMSLAILCEECEEAQALLSTELKETAQYKGLEKLMEALQSEISYSQSVMKYVDKGEKYGA